MPLNVDQLQVTSFDTVGTGTVTSPNPVTQPVPQCWSPLCVPTTVAPQCDTATNPV